MTRETLRNLFGDLCIIESRCEKCGAPRYRPVEDEHGAPIANGYVAQKHEKGCLRIVSLAMSEHFSAKLDTEDCMARDYAQMAQRGDFVATMDDHNKPAAPPPPIDYDDLQEMKAGRMEIPEVLK